MSSSTAGTQAPTLALSPKYPGVKLVARPNEERGNADHDWLKTFHTFSFASYYSPLYNQFGSLRVINEDRVEPNTGFGTHSHREMEIFSYIVKGELEHKDSMGNLEVMKRGDVQMTSAGTGISHSEYNRNKKEQVHFLQIWVTPSVSKLTPKYYARSFTDDEKRDTLLQIVSPLTSSSGVTDTREGKGPVPIHAPASVYASILSPKSTVTHTFSPSVSSSSEPRKAYIHLIQTSGYNTAKASGASVRINGGLALKEGDGAFAMASAGDKIEIENVGEGDAEFLVFDIE